MSKSKFAESLQGLSTEQFDRVAADMLAEAARRGNTADDWSRVGNMSDAEFNQFSRNAINATKASRDAAALARAAAASGKVLVDPKTATEGSDDESK